MGKNVTKKIANLNKVPHPKGRKAAQLSKKTIRAANRGKTKLHHQMKLNILGEKILWFKENLEPVEKYTPELTIKLIEKYLGRFDAELEQIQLKHTAGKRKSRQHASRQDIIKMTIKNETYEFLTCGIEMPDVLNSKQLDLLRNWSGELRFLQNFTLVRYTKDKLEKIKSSSKDVKGGEQTTEECNTKKIEGDINPTKECGAKEIGADENATEECDVKKNDKDSMSEKVSKKGNNVEIMDVTD